MYDESDIWFVDAHSKGDCGDNDMNLIVHPLFLCIFFILFREISVIVSCFVSSFVQLLADFFALSFREAVYDTCLSFISMYYLFDVVQDGFAFWSHLVVKIRSIEGRLEIVAAFDAQSADDILFDNFCDCGC